MKTKLMAFAASAALCGALFVTVSAHAENSFTFGSLTFDLDTGALTKCDTSASGNISIPAKIKGVAITSIGDNAFNACANVTGITMPDSVTSIGSCAFSDCSSLTSMAIPDGVTSIGRSAFFGCSGLTSVAIPDGVTSIGDYAFHKCSSLTSVAIPDGVTSIGDHAFYYCSSLTSVTIPDGVTSIGDYTFYLCSRLKSVTIPDGVTSIGDSAFRYCSRLTSVTIPDSVTSIGDWAFCDCSRLTSIYFNGSGSQWSSVAKGLNWNGNAKVYVNGLTTGSTYSTSTFADNSFDDGGATGFLAELAAGSSPYTLGNVTWTVLSGDDAKSTAPLSYGDITVTDASLVIGLTVTGLYDPDAMAAASYEMTSTGYVEYTE